MDNLLERQKLLDAKYQTMARFAGKIAHNIGNPLAAIMLRLEYASSSSIFGDGEPTDFQEHVEFLQTQTERIRDILEKLGQLQSHAEKDVSEVDLKDIVERAIAISEFNRPFKNVHVNHSQVKDVPQSRMCDFRIETAVNELLSNALEAAGENGHVSLELDFDEEKYELVLKVIDDGPGILEEDVVNIFDPFFTTKTDRKGRGMGLTLAYAAVANHGGMIHVERTNNNKTVFIVTLPLNQKM